jgi:hypothetical protein
MFTLEGKEGNSARSKIQIACHTLVINQSINVTFGYMLTGTLNSNFRANIAAVCVDATPCPSDPESHIPTAEFSFAQTDHHAPF